MFGLFAVAASVAVFVPGASEAVLAALIVAEVAKTPSLVAVATLGNTGAAIGLWWLGALATAPTVERWWPVSRQRAERAQRVARSFGAISALFSVLPIIGGPVAVAAGMLRQPLLSFALLAGAARLAWYGGFAYSVTLAKQVL
jgi:membrane protein YqaA with SNARE-associated domain